MRKRKKRPHYTAKPGQLDSAQVKDYAAQIIHDTGWLKNPFTGFSERTTVEKHGDRYDIKIEMEGGLYFKPAGND